MVNQRIWILVAVTSCALPPGEPEPELGETEEEAAATPPNGGTLAEPFDGVRWPNGEVHYVIDSRGDWPLPNSCKHANEQMTEEQIDALEVALDEYRALTPLRFVEHTVDNPPPSGSYIIYRATPGTSSAAEVRGMPPDGVTPNCVYFAETYSGPSEARRHMLHETGHALGLSHEQQRPDRDFMIVYDPTCAVDTTGRKYDIDADGLLLTPYDYESIMQYSSGNSCACKVDGVCQHPPLVKTVPSCTSDPPLPGDPCWIDTPTQLSIHDVNVFHRMYERALGHDNPGDEFGAAIAVGDFDGDGYMDVAVGAPGNDPNGAVYLWKGTGGALQNSQGRLVAWKILLPSDAPAGTTSLVSAGRFGAALAAGDFDGDGRTDLAIGAPGADGGGIDDGTVFFYRQQEVPSSPRRTLQFWGVTSQILLGQGFGQPGDGFGQALAAGDFDHDGKDDLAIGIPKKSVNGVSSGEVIVRLASAQHAGVVLLPTQVPSGQSTPGARFGAALAAANFSPDNSNGDDLAIGSPEDATAPALSGAVYVFAGETNGSFTGKQLLRPAVTGGPIRFGAALAVGDFDHTTTPKGFRTRQLAIGAPNRTRSVATSGWPIAVAEAGAVYWWKPVSASAVGFSEVGRLDEGLLLGETRPASYAHFGGVLLDWKATAPGANDVLIAGLPDVGGGQVELYDGFGSMTNRFVDPAGVAGDRYGAALGVGTFGHGRGVDIHDAPVFGSPGYSRTTGAWYLRDLGIGTWQRFLQSSANPE